MSTTKNIITTAILLLLLIAVFFATKDTDKEISSKSKIKEDPFAINPIGKKAPDFSLKNLQGEVVKLSDFKGKKVLVNFWATWCPPCQEEAPAIEKFHKDNPDVIILAVNIDPNQDIKGFIDKYQTTFPVLLDEEKSVSTMYGTFKIPETYFINEDGIVKNKRIGSMDYNVMKTLVDIM